MGFFSNANFFYILWLGPQFVPITNLVRISYKSFVTFDNLLLVLRVFSSEVNKAISKMDFVEVLRTPDKSENDKKDYR